jgi:DNA-binding response OmpR family regulator
MKQPTILMIEDDPSVSTVTRDLFLKEGYEVKSVSKAMDGWNALQKGDFDLIVLDLGLPDMDGLELCAKIKKDPVKGNIPVFILTALGSSEDTVRGLEAGAEDYLSKPFNEREFLARARAILRRREPLLKKDELIISGAIRLSIDSHEAWRGEEPVQLTLREFDILKVFLANPGKSLTREEIVKMAWGPNTTIVPKVVDVHVGHLRAKLGPEGKRIATVPQVGYKLVPHKT